MARLTNKQEKFVEELIKGKSQREAYKLAGYKTDKMADKTIDEAASRLFKNSKVLARYEELRARLVKEAEDECIVSAKEVLRELKRIGFADIKDYLSYRTAKTVVGYDKDTGEPIIDYAQIIELIESEKIDGRLIQEVSINSKGVFTFKLHDKMAALDRLGKYLGMFTDKVEVSSQVNNPFEGLTTEELKLIIQKL